MQRNRRLITPSERFVLARCREPPPTSILRTRLRAITGFVLGTLIASWGAIAEIPNLGAGAPDLINLQSRLIPGAGGSPTLLDNGVRGVLPLSHSPRDSWVLNLYADDFHVFDPPLTLVPSGAIVPTDLWTVDATVAYNFRFDPTHSLILSLGIGSNSDQIFHTWNETAVNVTGMYRMPAAGKDEWLFGANVSNNRPVLNFIPIPIVAYTFRRPEENLSATVGIPFATLNWGFAPRWDTYLAAIGPTRLTAELGFHATESVRLHAGGYWSQQLWALAGRSDPSSRLFFDAKKLALGAQVPLLGPFVVDLTGGWSFDQSFFNGTSVFSRGDQGTLGSSAYAAVNLKFPLPIPTRRDPRSVRDGASPEFAPSWVEDENVAQETGRAYD